MCKFNTVPTLRAIANKFQSLCLLSFRQRLVIFGQMLYFDSTALGRILTHRCCVLLMVLFARPGRFEVLRVVRGVPVPLHGCRLWL